MEDRLDSRQRTAGNRRREGREEAVAVIQTREVGGSDQDGSSGGGERC